MKNWVTAQKPLVYLITKGAATAENFRAHSVEILNIVESAVLSGVSMIQIREKQLSAKLVFELAAKAAAITNNSNTKLLVNDRADIARAAGADGVHLTSQSIPAQIVRRDFGADFIVGVSAHSRAEVETAKRAGADFATFSPIYATPSKAVYGAPQGVAKLREIVQAVEDFPVIALGGIEASNFGEVLKTGAAGIGAIRFLSDAEDLKKIIQNIENYEAT